MFLKFIKYSFVGAFGFLVHIVILYIGKAYIFDKSLGVFYGIDISLNLSLFLAIIIAMTVNFLLNNYWTWGYLGHNIKIKNYFKYVKITFFSVFLQIILTNLITSMGSNYLIANLISIIVGSIIGFILNDRLNFK